MADANSIRPPIAARSANGTPLYENKCSGCGNVRLSDFRRLLNQCLPCANKAKSKGLTKSPLYKVLQGIKVRCNYPSATNYEYYGGRGIRVCQEWLDDPMSFIKWGESNGYRKGLELDRIDVNGPYSPQNCRFIGHKTNSRMRRNARCDEEKASQVKTLLAGGEPIKTAAAYAGVPYMSAWHIAKGNTWKEIK